MKRFKIPVNSPIVQICHIRVCAGVFVQKDVQQSAFLLFVIGLFQRRRLLLRSFPVHLHKGQLLQAREVVAPLELFSEIHALPVDWVFLFL